MIMDAHIHMGYNGEMGRGFNYESLKQFKHDEKIGECLVFPIHGNERSIEQSHYWIKQLAQEDDTIKPLFWLPSDPFSDGASKALKDGFIGLKYHASYEKTPISSPMFDNILRELDTKKGILLVHCGTYLNASIESNTSYLHAVITAAKWKNIKVILAHMGGSIMPIIKQVCEHVRGIDNIWLETSGITSPNVVDYAVNYIGVRKILFGSDAPWCSFKAMYHNVMDSNLPEAKKKLILEENLLDVLR